MPTLSNEIIQYDGRTLAFTIHPLIQVEARRGRRWKWFGQKGWWVHLYLFRGWHLRKFVVTLSEAVIIPVGRFNLDEDEDNEGAGRLKKHGE